MNFNERYAEDRRLVLLRALLKTPAYALHEFMLQSEAARYGHSVSRDLLRVDLAWLAEQGLVKVDKANTTHVATLTARGHDVAQGNATVPGVKRPLPGDD